MNRDIPSLAKRAVYLWNKATKQDSSNKTLDKELSTSPPPPPADPDSTFAQASSSSRDPRLSRESISSHAQSQDPRRTLLEESVISSREESKSSKDPRKLAHEREDPSDPSRQTTLSPPPSPPPLSPQSSQNTESHLNDVEITSPITSNVSKNIRTQSIRPEFEIQKIPVPSSLPQKPSVVYKSMGNTRGPLEPYNKPGHNYPVTVRSNSLHQSEHNLDNPQGQEKASSIQVTSRDLYRDDRRKSYSRDSQQQTTRDNHLRDVLQQPRKISLNAQQGHVQEQDSSREAQKDSSRVELQSSISDFHQGSSKNVNQDLVPNTERRPSQEAQQQSSQKAQKGLSPEVQKRQEKEFQQDTLQEVLKDNLQDTSENAQPNATKCHTEELAKSLTDNQTEDKTSDAQDPNMNSAAKDAASKLNLENLKKKQKYSPLVPFVRRFKAPMPLLTPVAAPEAEQRRRLSDKTHHTLDDASAFLRAVQEKDKVARLVPTENDDVVLPPPPPLRRKNSLDKKEISEAKKSIFPEFIISRNKQKEKEQDLPKPKPKAQEVGKTKENGNEIVPSTRLTGEASDNKRPKIQTGKSKRKKIRIEEKSRQGFKKHLSGEPREPSISQKENASNTGRAIYVNLSDDSVSEDEDVIQLDGTPEGPLSPEPFPFLRFTSPDSGAVSHSQIIPSSSKQLLISKAGVSKDNHKPAISNPSKDLVDLNEKSISISLSAASDQKLTDTNLKTLDASSGLISKVKQEPVKEMEDVEHIHSSSDKHDSHKVSFPMDKEGTVATPSGHAKESTKWVGPFILEADSQVDLKQETSQRDILVSTDRLKVHNLKAERKPLTSSFSPINKVKPAILTESKKSNQSSSSSPALRKPISKSESPPPVIKKEDTPSIRSTIGSSRPLQSSIKFTTIPQSSTTILSSQVSLPEKIEKSVSTSSTDSKPNPPSFLVRRGSESDLPSAASGFKQVTPGTSSSSGSKTAIPVTSSSRPNFNVRKSQSMLRPRSHSLVPQDLRVQIEEMVKQHSISFEHVLLALKMTNLQPEKAMMVLGRIITEKPVPSSNEVWTSLDDENLLTASDITALKAKYGAKACRKRLRFLKGIS